jgi:hypothetical protein
MGWTTEKLGFYSQQRQEMCLFSLVLYLLLGAHKASYTMGAVECFPAVKTTGCVTDHSPPSSIEVKQGTAIPLFVQTPSQHYS